MTRPLQISLLALFFFQVCISAGFELAHDEAYYWIFSKHLDWGFFDHPPVVAAVIKFFSFLPHAEWSVRLGFIILQFLSVIILLSLTSYSLVSLLLFFSFPLASMAGLLALPDMPLLFFTALYCYVLKKYLEKDDLKTAGLLGLIIALLFYAKYHGVLVVFFTLVALPKLLTRKSFYVIFLVAFLLFLPHIIWQYKHDFQTLRYHFLERPGSSFSIKRSLEYVGLQIILAGAFVGPVVWWALFKSKATSEFDRAMKLITVGTVVFFLISSFSKRIEANWMIFIAVPMIYLVANHPIWQKKSMKVLLFTSFQIVVLARVLFIVSPNNVPIKRLKEFHGWKFWAHEVQAQCGTTPILANTYQIAGKLSYYLDQEISAINIGSRKNQFDNWRWDKSIPTNEVCYITNQMEFQGNQIETPEGKKLVIVKNQSIQELWALK